MSEDLNKIRRNFRRETGKLDNWMYQPLRISDFSEKDLDFYEELKQLCRMRREGEISADEWHRLTGNLIRRYQRRDV